MRVYSTVFLLSILSASCMKNTADQNNLVEAQNYNNNRAYARTIDLLENDSSLSIEEKKVLIHAYAGDAGLEAAKIQEDIKKIEKVLSQNELSITDKVKEILKILPREDQKKLSRLNAAILLFEQVQAAGGLQDADSKFQLGVLYFYRAAYGANLMLQFADEGIAQKLEYRLSDLEFDSVMDFYNVNMGKAISDIGKSYNQLVNSYDKIKKIAHKIDEMFNFFLSDQQFRQALDKDFKSLGALYEAYFNDAGKHFDVYLNDLDFLADALGLEKTARSIFDEFRNNPEKVERVLARIEMTIQLFLDSSSDKYEKELKYFNEIFPLEIKEEFKVKVAESWRAKSTAPISAWLRNNNGTVQKLKDFIKVILEDASARGIDKNIQGELKILVDMLDKKAIEKLGQDLEIFNYESEKYGDELSKDIDLLENEYSPEFEKASDKINTTLDNKTNAFNEKYSNEEIEITEEEAERMNKNVELIEKAIEE